MVQLLYLFQKIFLEIDDEAWLGFALLRAQERGSKL